ncbi:outer membrane protein transport protein [uncultured Alistipes sp.]|uniref:OmpP1/FadL family transporter n=1 Tax=uncultured Alistipes sp. TaxID=538949 RepID=UPI001F9B404E|nr:outer membrane protein transport protein [uncultured Alistipes sp.]HJC26630.1 outer membrane protein transport protein [Candidatus Alistipes stercoravium]
MKKFLLLLASAGLASGAFAEGYQVNNFSARQAGMANVGTAMKLGAESIYFNPAATVFQESKFNISLGATGILSSVSASTLPSMENGYKSTLTEDSDNKMSTPLHMYINYKPSERWAVGLGFYTPNGSSMNWGDNWSGSHLVQEINLAAYTFQPTVSFKICDRLSIGAGLMITWGNFDLSRAMLPIGAGNQTLVSGFNTVNALLPALGPAAGLTAEEIAQYQATAQQGAAYFTQNLQDRSIVSARLEGSANVAIGVNAGILWDVTDQWSVAMSYRSRMNMKVDKGTAQLIYASQEARQLLSFLNTILQTAGQASAIPALDQGTFHTQLALPTTVTWGVSYRPNDRWQMGVDLQWIGWSAYKDLNVSFNEKELGIKDIYSVKNYSNTLSARFGAEYRALDWLTARAGIYYDESPVDSNFLNPETPSMTKITYTLGASFRLARCAALDIAYCYVSSADPERTGSYPIYDYASGELASVFTRNYKLHAHVLSFGMRFNF